ncbi:MAG: hypothetical protein QW279_10160 [Candidatus Jordarchaeaceae archaeon]
MSKKIYPSGFLYTSSLMWVTITDEQTVRIGLTQQICDCFKELSKNGAYDVCCELKSIGAEVKRMEPLGAVKMKGVTFELTSPVSGRIKKINDEALNNISALNNDPEKEWVAEVEPTNLEEDIQYLFTPQQYEEFCKYLWYFLRAQL